MNSKCIPSNANSVPVIEDIERFVKDHQSNGKVSVRDLMIMLASTTIPLHK